VCDNGGDLTLIQLDFSINTYMATQAPRLKTLVVCHPRLDTLLTIKKQPEMIPSRGHGVNSTHNKYNMLFLPGKAVFTEEAKFS